MKAGLSGIISDVAAAADPRRAEAARRRLGSLAGFDKTQFRNLIGTGAGPTQYLSGKESSPTLAARKSSSQAPAEDPVGAAYRALGAVLLQKTFESMLPDQSGIVASKGAASSMWKSMLAQQLADSVSTSVFRPPGSPGNLKDILSHLVPE